jgi:hypothetical protein
MRNAIVTLIVTLLVTTTSALASGGFEVPLPQKGEPIPPIQRCVVESLRVDGLFVVQHGWCAWDTEQEMWIPLSSDLARSRVFGIRPIPE